MYDGGGAASSAVSDVDDRPPLISTTTEDGLEHRLWAITDPGVLDAIAADLYPRRAVIADGHHRYANYLHHQADRHGARAGTGPWDHGLVFLVDATAFGPQVHAIHRVVPAWRSRTRCPGPPPASPCGTCNVGDPDIAEAFAQLQVEVSRTIAALMVANAPAEFRTHQPDFEQATEMTAHQLTGAVPNRSRTGGTTTAT